MDVLKPLTASFRFSTSVVVQASFLAAADPTLAHPTARVVLRSTFESLSTKGSVAPVAHFTRTPSWASAMVCEAPLHTGAFDPNGGLALVFEDAVTHQFYGMADLPGFGATAEPRRLMLLPQPADPDTPGVKRAGHLDLLKSKKLDDFGFVTVVVQSQLFPRGPCIPPDRACPLPGYLRSRFFWLCAPGAAPTDARLTLRNGTSIQVSEQPLLLPLSSSEESQLHFQLQWKAIDGVIHTSQLTITVPLHVSDAELAFAVPVTAGGPRGTLSAGVAVIVVKALSTAPAVDAPPPSTDEGRAPPQIPRLLSALPAWKSHDHIARASERRWRRTCAVDCKPTAEHLQHLSHALRSAGTISTSFQPVFASFFNLTASSAALTRQQIEQVFIALCFACPTFTVKEACLMAASAFFQGQGWNASFFLIRTILENCLLPSTIDLTTAENESLARDVFPLAGDSSTISFEDFIECFAENIGLWALLGVAVEGPLSSTIISLSSANRPQASADEDDGWRSFVVRLGRNKKGFAVTAQTCDSLSRVAKMLEATVDIPKARQRFFMNDQELDVNQLVGAVVPKQAPTTVPIEITLHERDDMVTVILVHRARDRKWEHRVALDDKVLKLRAFVQTKTMLPLSRIEMTCRGEPLWDRHSVAQSRLFEGSVIEITEKHVS